MDLGNVSNPDAADGFDRTIAILKSLASHDMFVAVLGGDNSITLQTMLGLYADTLPTSALITFDAHHDLRDGWSNGSPVRQIVEAGLPGTNIVQIGIAGFANSRAYSERARDLGIHVITREQCHRRSAADVMNEAFDVVGDKPTHIDVDLDVCDRSIVPGCPASSPGGLSAHYLRDMVFLAAQRQQTRSMDFVEVDANADTPDGRTVRLTALCLLEAAAGLTSRMQHEWSNS
jgi:formiminoglutamase